ncbi:MAG: AAA family ATPase [Muribaculaceae bacterium]|nr:AAA family ATPase [Muribaculaceae bacterium]
MENIIKTSRRLVSSVQTKTKRYLFNKINWSDRLIMIKGSRGVGKTTLFLQYIKEKFGATGPALYVSCDNLWFTDNKIIDLADYHYEHGGTHLFLDEIHRYQGNWQQELKNIYDAYPDYHVAFTGSSMIHLDAAVADLSRRCLPYQLYGMSFREFLNFNGYENLPELSLDQVLDSEHKAEWDIICNLNEKILVLFERYIGKGYYPFFEKDKVEEYYGRIERIIDTTITQDIPAIEKVEFDTLHKLGKLLYVLSTDVPFTLNVQSLSSKIQVSRATIVRMFDLLDKGGILRNIHSSWMSPKSVAKPEKILFNNTDIMAALSSMNEIGTVRETFVASMLSQAHKIYEPPTGDFLVDEKYILEVGGKRKNYKQIADLSDSYIVAGDVESGTGNKIPMWLFGFLY